MPLKNKSLSRRLIRLLKDIMAGTLSSEKKLDYILRCIYAAFSADTVCLYTLSSKQELTLIECKGIKSETFHKKVLQSGDGLIGAVLDTKAPLYIPDITEHPDLQAYTLAFITFLGIPLLRGGQCIGVLSIEMKYKTILSEESIEDLETISVTLSEIIAQSTSQNLTSHPEPEHNMHKLPGISLSHGSGVGIAYFYTPETISHKVLSNNPLYEIKRLNKALTHFNETLEDTLQNLSDHLSKQPDTTKSPVEIIESYQMIAQDKSWTHSIHAAIHLGLTAESALEKVLSEIKMKIFSNHESFMIELLYDLEDFTHRLINILVDDKKIDSLKSLDTDFILISKNLGPAELLDYHHPHLKGIILESGSTTSHVAIIARALGIPLLGWVSQALTKIPQMSKIILDASSGFVYLSPTESLLKVYTQEIDAHNLSKIRHEKSLSSPKKKISCVSKEGIPISLFLNAGLSNDLNYLHLLNADGIGLFRTEIPFMLEGEFPDVSIQTQMYKKIFDMSDNKPIYFRILDIGGDKPLPYFNHPIDPNPLVGWRALRLLLDRPSLLKHQIRSLIRAAHGKELNIMFPMVTEYVEFELSKKIIHQEIERELSFNRPTPSNIRCGITVEVPSIAWQLPKFIQHVDFVSVGSNDLFQFFFASDRLNPKLHYRYDVLSPAFLSFLAYILDICNAHNVPVSLCGEMASRPLEALALIAIGFRTLSLNPSCFLCVKKMILDLNIKDASNFITPLLASSSHSLRKQLKQFAQENLDHRLQTPSF